MKRSTHPQQPVAMDQEMSALVGLPCVLCGGDALRVVYRGLRYPKKPTERRYAMARCNHCGLLQVSPRPSAQEIAEVYTDADYRAGELQAKTKQACFVEIGALDCIERRVPRGRVLDVGCGAGHFLRWARERGWETAGQEIAPHSAQFARQSYGLDIFTGPVEGMSCPPNAFDLITLIGVIEHVSRPVEFLRRLRSFLKPGGTLFLLTDNDRSWMHWLMRERFPWIIPPEHLQLFSPRSMAALLSRAGYRLERIESMETIFWDAAARGLAALVHRNGRQAAAPGALEAVMKALLGATYPVRWLLWQCNLGAQIYVFARTADSPEPIE